MTRVGERDVEARVGDHDHHEAEAEDAERPPAAFVVTVVGLVARGGVGGSRRGTGAGDGGGGWGLRSMLIERLITFDGRRMIPVGANFAGAFSGPGIAWARAR